MVPEEVFELKNGEPVMAGVLGGDYKDRMAVTLLRSYSDFELYSVVNQSISFVNMMVVYTWA